MDLLPTTKLEFASEGTTEYIGEESYVVAEFGYGDGHVDAKLSNANNDGYTSFAILDYSNTTFGFGPNNPYADGLFFVFGLNTSFAQSGFGPSLRLGFDEQQNFKWNGECDFSLGF